MSLPDVSLPDVSVPDVDLPDVNLPNGERRLELGRHKRGMGALLVFSFA